MHHKFHMRVVKGDSNMYIVGIVVSQALHSKVLERHVGRKLPMAYGHTDHSFRSRAGMRFAPRIGWSADLLRLQWLP